ncbi:MAG: pilus assembly protein CpaC [Hyphomicrobiales bacterium]|nr:MAG: pilus assembly protein CpaC [Hyphomicrobiales bacterium]
MKNTLAKITFALPIIAGLVFAAMVAPATANEAIEDAVIVTVDRAKIFRVSRPASTIIIGNPAIVDAVIEDAKTLILTGRSFGVTNLIILDVNGDPIVDKTILVRGHEIGTIRIYRRSSRVTLACAPVCEPTLTIGDNAKSFAFASQQIKAKNALALANAK